MSLLTRGLGPSGSPSEIILGGFQLSSGLRLELVAQVIEDQEIIFLRRKFVVELDARVVIGSELATLTRGDLDLPSRVSGNYELTAVVE